VDPGGDAEEIISSIDRLGLDVVGIVATHAHFDHIVAAQPLRDATGAPFLLHSGDLGWLPVMQESARLWLGLELGPAPGVDRALSDQDVLDVGGVELAVLHTPGHSEGSISLLSGATVFSGDALFAGSVGRTDLPGGSEEVLHRAIRDRLLRLDDEVVVLPGHGPATTVGRERRSNPYVGSGGLWTG
jgi:glyoxylase-like metal-dependent hydrolase (beta-lactamase superfamily II)